MRPTPFLLVLLALSAGSCSDEVEGHVPERIDAEVSALLEGVPNGLPLAGDERVYGGGQPDLQTLKDLKGRGFTLVINLRQEQESTPAEEQAALEAAGVAYVTVPIHGGKFTFDDAEALADALAQRPEDGSVLIHCGSGSRVGALYAAMRHRRDGLSRTEALELAQTSGKVRASSMDRLRELLPAE